MASVNRGCTVHGKNVGLHGDKTSTGARCIAARPGMSVMGLWKLYIGDKTTPCPKCGKVGVIVSGDPRCSNSAAVAVDGAEILCGCPLGINFLIAPGTVEVNTPSWAIAPGEPMQRVQPAKKQNRFAGTCKPEDNPLLNGVYIWTETKNAGHAFVSVHENNNVYLYTYGRYGRTNRGGFTGDGVLNFLQDEDARVYYRSELYEMGARVFRIDDADPVKTRAFFEDLWNSSKPAIQTSKMPETTRRRGHTIDEYDVTGSNCTTHSVAGIKYAGSTVFEHGYTSTTTQLPIEAEEDFTVPVSLQRFLIAKGGDMSSMLVVEMTKVFKEQYPNSDNLRPFQETPGGVVQHVAAEGAATGDSLSPYSGGTVGGVLGGSYGDDE
ncbi:PAAR domain-containing protein [Enterobacter roggenkampii]|uniref:PAAR domain-containing protein n=2 Tax=Enterobacter roggenkampii TaxID=1812935 RepID=A0ABD7GQ02_9ENTR|nr:PAAR domain-containing protein [Enterobacter roggenkampii]MBA7741212.1 PAAR domain-containing protein [Enterobacter roggenkampii]MBT2030208.1 PAAR domain-containing protein [Enterobacter roggenkampii]MBT2034761.1 PAAR domain-containing protein [Enterobacter roggenkampii]MEA5193848.1 PAAR domain-containing protein [Enterobacter roggenkampii]QBA37697.1 PAAR domain-containing protein [Enterobacter roggenkampii]